MKRFCVALFVCVILLSAAAKRACAQAAVPDRTPPSYDMKGQALLDLVDMEKKFISLAQAIPARDYTWRPGPGVRSISEAYLHVADLNFQMPTTVGVAPAPGYVHKDFEISTTDKPRVVAELRQSFEYFRAFVEQMSNVDFNKPEKSLGRNANEGDVVYLVIADDHEHLGQSVAYARMKGIVPPWTAEAERKREMAERWPHTKPPLAF